MVIFCLKSEFNMMMVWMVLPPKKATAAIDRSIATSRVSRNLLTIVMRRVLSFSANCVFLSVFLSPCDTCCAIGPACFDVPVHRSVSTIVICSGWPFADPNE